MKTAVGLLKPEFSAPCGVIFVDYWSSLTISILAALSGALTAAATAYFAEPIRRVINRVSEWLLGRFATRPHLVIWSWDQLNTLGQSRTWQSSYILLFAVPACAKLLSRLPDELGIPLFDFKLHFTLQMPFSWTVLYAAATFATIGNIVYALRCPAVVKQYSSFPQFEAQTRTADDLTETVDMMSPLGTNERSPTMVRVQMNRIQKNFNSAPIDTDAFGRGLFEDGRVDARIFYFIRNAAIWSRPLARLFASLAYIAAFGCLAIVFAEGALYVVNVFFRPIDRSSSAISALTSVC